MLGETITIYNYVKELNGKAQYNRFVVDNVVIDRNKGRNRLVSGDTNAATATLYFMNKDVDMSKYKPSIEWQALSESNKALYWTIDDKTYMAVGQSTYEVKTQTVDLITTTGTIAGLKAMFETLQVKTIDTRNRGSGFANHIEVGAN